MSYSCEKLKQFVAAVMEDAGLSGKDAAQFADSLLYAQMRGIGSHGLTRLATYYRRAKEGLVNARAVPQILSGQPSLLLIDGHNGMGVTSAVYAMDECIERAQATGCCFAAVRGGNHFGCASYFAERAARKGMLGIAMANGPTAMAPIGGKEPVLGTNPLAIAIPAAGRDPFVLDMATSVVARGKVALAAKEGRQIPPDWGIDAQGKPTTDPNAVKCVLPFGGAKGYGIALMIEVLCSCLSGAKTGQTMGSFYDFSGKHQDSGFFVGALNVGGITAPGAFASGTAGLFDSIKNSPKADGCDEIFIPGEIERRNYLRAEKEGITLSAPILAELKALAQATGIPFAAEQ